MLKKISRNHVLFVTFITMLIVYLAIFFNFLPNSSGGMGHDHSISLPALLDGYFWFNQNGLLEAPWFTPSFCGGSLNLANPLTAFLSVQQFITFLVEPVTAVRITFAIFAILGAWGFYSLMRKSFSLSLEASLLSGTLFLFNGFYTYRIIIGHLGFFAFMLIPFMAYFLTRKIISYKKQMLFDSMITGFIFAYMIFTGFSSLMLPTVATLLVIGIVHTLLAKASLRLFLSRLFFAGLVGIILSISRLILTITIMGNFPRSSYLLPGAKNIFATLYLLIKSLFISPASDSVKSLVTNMQWYIDRHEFEFGVTVIPLILIIVACIKGITLIKTRQLNFQLSKKQLSTILVLVLLLIFPIIANTYSPWWNQILKSIPIIKNSSSLFRWFIIYIPFVIVLSAIAFDYVITQKRIKFAVCLLILAGIAHINIFSDKSFYQKQSYNPSLIIDAYKRVKEKQWTPKIKEIVVYQNKQGQIVLPKNRNDSFLLERSPLYCYEPLFGYRLEHLPIKQIRPGPIFTDGKTPNIKNPACYAWPKLNNCSPGDSFKISEIVSAKAFVNYLPFSFKMPRHQKIANIINIVALVLVMTYFAVSFLIFIKRIIRLRRHS